MEASQGDDVRMEVSVKGYPVPEVNWYKDDLPVIESDKLRLSRDNGTCALMVKNVTPEDSGVYKCEAKSEKGCVTKRLLLAIEGNVYS